MPFFHAACFVFFVLAAFLPVLTAETMLKTDPRLLNGSDSTEPLEALVGWLLEDTEKLDSVPFADVVRAVSGFEVLAVERDNTVDAAMLDVLEAALVRSFKTLKDPGHSLHGIGRVNEISREVESELLKQLNAAEGYTCAVPVNASGSIQRSGYPDLRFRHEASGRVFYIDPKVYRAGSEDSSFRTFYFEPRKETNKVLEDASHLIVGIAHSGKVNGRWQLDQWQIIDLVDFRVRLKAEFQASNRDLYKDSAVLGRGGE